jgi:RNA polymerase sigma factor (sigma-70 family)
LNGNIENELLKKEQLAIFYRAYEKLPSKEKVLINLYKNDLSYKEMADMINIKKSSVGKLLSRAIEKLTKEIKYV